MCFPRRSHLRKRQKRSSTSWIKGEKSESSSGFDHVLGVDYSVHQQGVVGKPTRTQIPKYWNHYHVNFNNAKAWTVE